MTRIKKKLKQMSACALICLGAIACKESIPAVGDEPIKPMKEYTLENAREWTDIAKFHAPTAKKSSHNGRAAVIVEVPIEKANEGHYIEKIGIMDMTGKELGTVTLKRERNPNTYAYFYSEILPWSGKVKIFAKCNKHDLWVKEMYAKDLAM